MSNANWILRNGVQNIDCTSFPYAYRTMFNIVRKGIADKKPVDTKKLSILGPKNIRGDRTTYSYASATTLARSQGLLDLDGQINSREFKRK
jgi:hypothetical protein